MKGPESCSTDHCPVLSDLAAACSDLFAAVVRLYPSPPSSPSPYRARSSSSSSASVGSAASSFGAIVGLRHEAARLREWASLTADMDVELFGGGEGGDGLFLEPVVARVTIEVLGITAQLEHLLLGAGVVPIRDLPEVRIMRGCIDGFVSILKDTEAMNDAEAAVLAAMSSNAASGDITAAVEELSEMNNNLWKFTTALTLMASAPKGPRRPRIERVPSVDERTTIQPDRTPQGKTLVRRRYRQRRSSEGRSKPGTRPPPGQDEKGSPVMGSRPPSDQDKKSPFTAGTRPPSDQGERRSSIVGTRPPPDQDKKSSFIVGTRSSSDRGGRRPSIAGTRLPSDQDEKSPFVAGARLSSGQGERSPFIARTRPPSDHNEKSPFIADTRPLSDQDKKSPSIARTRLSSDRGERGSFIARTRPLPDQGERSPSIIGTRPPSDQNEKSPSIVGTRIPSDQNEKSPFIVATENRLALQETRKRPPLPPRSLTYLTPLPKSLRPPTSNPKVVLIGSGHCGKTSAISSFTTRSFSPIYVPTTFADHLTHAGSLQHVKMAMVDTAGLEEYDLLRPLSYPGADVVVICFSIGCRRSLGEVTERWLPEHQSFAPALPFILAGLKSDLRYEHPSAADGGEYAHSPVSYAQGLEVARAAGAVAYIECSARSGYGVQEAFDAVADVAVWRKEKREVKKGESCVVM
ncbi:hypothetical protein FGG08_007389 [Glutinoglossum americanum]|uniref:Uncharacterized protein n=1 Tax=Glutinoglossum americanum TaxID=1670608 RepID=A0A9P8HU12_9PEZI|nr:hypothetical protein FGG08_007389 [Glutinoglossum americanum]